jgi:HK97 family phage prohead protease
MNKNENIERRFLTITQRAAGDDDKPVIEGDAAVFNQETVIGSWFREKIAPGAFKRVLSEKPDVVAAFNHNWDIVLGRTTAGTLSLEETEKSLRYSTEINPKDPAAMGVYERVKRGDVSQASFAFTVRKEEWVSPPANSKDLPLRNILEVDELYDVGPCTFGAYPEASASARSKANEFANPEEPAAQQELPAEETSGVSPQEQAENERRRLDFLKLKLNPTIK